MQVINDNKSSQSFLYSETVQLNYYMHKSKGLKFLSNSILGWLRNTEEVALTNYGRHIHVHVSQKQYVTPIPPPFHYNIKDVIILIVSLFLLNLIVDSIF